MGVGLSGGWRGGAEGRLSPGPRGRDVGGHSPRVGHTGEGFVLFLGFFFPPPHQRFPVKAERDKCTSRGQPGSLGVGAGAVDTGSLTSRQWSSNLLKDFFYITYPFVFF